MCILKVQPCYAVSMDVCNRNKLLYYCMFDLYVIGLVPSYGILSLMEGREEWCVVIHIWRKTDMDMSMSRVEDVHSDIFRSNEAAI